MSIRFKMFDSLTDKEKEQFIEEYITCKRPTTVVTKDELLAIIEWQYKKIKYGYEDDGR